MAEPSVTESLPLLPSMPVDAPAHRLALAVTLISLIVFVALLPYTQVQLAPLAAFIPLYESGLVLNDLITAVMLFGHFSILRSRSLLVLAGGYLFTMMVTVSHMLSFPGLFSAGGLLGNGSQSTAWLYVFWHAGFPACVAAYALLGHRERRQPHPMRRPKRAVLWAIAAVLLAAGAVILLCTAGHDLLPPILQSGTYTLAGRIVFSTNWICSGLAIFVLWRYSSRSMLDLWLGVVLAAWICDIGLSAVLNAGHFDVGWYAGRIYGLLAASCVLIVLLLESNKLFARLVVVHEHALQRGADLQRLNLQSEQRAMQYANALEELHFKEEEIRAVVHNIADCVVTTDAGGMVKSANPALDKVFGYAAADVIGQHISMLIPELVADSEHAFIRDGEVAGRHRDGRHLPLELARSAWRAAVGSGAGRYQRAQTVRGRTAACADQRRAGQQGQVDADHPRRHPPHRRRGGAGGRRAGRPQAPRHRARARSGIGGDQQPGADRAREGGAGADAGRGQRGRRRSGDEQRAS